VLVLRELVAGLLRPRLFPFGKLSKLKSAAHGGRMKRKEKGKEKERIMKEEENGED
jgi:hypothetical protein